jgi:flagellar basal-body rod modification protein FlgD
MIRRLAPRAASVGFSERSAESEDSQMSRIPATTPTPALGTNTNDITSFNTDEFLQLMIAELQNQNPLNPMDNSQLMDQISQIREIGATELLTTTLSAVQAGQNLATASGLIGQEVVAISDDLEEIRGVVDRVSVEVDSGDETKRTLRVHVGESSFDLNNIREVTERSVGNADNASGT